MLRSSICCTAQSKSVSKFLQSAVKVSEKVTVGLQGPLTAFRAFISKFVYQELSLFVVLHTPSSRCT